MKLVVCLVPAQLLGWGCDTGCRLR
jgi:hypothetical protein